MFERYYKYSEKNEELERYKQSDRVINDFDNYQYYSEAKYKELLNPFLLESKLELTTSELQVIEFKGTERQPFGRRVVVVFSLKDTQTGYSETTYHSGEAIDKTDKALYKAKTGAIKYYISSTFLIATYDDPEREDEKPKTKPITNNKKPTQPINKKKGSITPGQKTAIKSMFKDDVDTLKEIGLQHSSNKAENGAEKLKIK